jgi:glutamate/tyrosine decarboxylase-like PLP-dependent enzyme
MGTDTIEAVAVDDQGRMRLPDLVEALTRVAGPAIVVAQAGEVNTGAFDPLSEIISAARSVDAWVHIDGAFGIWARVSPEHEHLVVGMEDADSWAFDCHKWLNVPYDSGVAIVADPAPHRASMAGEAAYLAPTPRERDSYDWTPEASRRAPGVPVYAALRSLGRQGVRELVERCCRHARLFASQLSTLPGVEIVNEVDLNQVLLRFADDDTTTEVLAALQASGEAWMGGTTWEGRPAIRISVSSWAARAEHVTRTVEAFRAVLAR